MRHFFRSKRLWIFFALAVPVMPLVFFFMSFRAEWGMHAAPPIVRVAYDNYPGSLPGILAQKLGYLQNSSCTIELVHDGDHMQINSRFVAGFYSGIATTLGTAVASSSVLSEQRIVYIKDDSWGSDVLLADNSISDLTQLRGKKIGVVIGGFSEFWLDFLLAKVGMQIDDVEITPIDGSRIAEHIQKKDIDAGHSWTPYWERGLAQGQKVLASTENENFVIVDVIVFRHEAIKNHRQCIKEFLAAWSQAVVYWRTHPSEAAVLLGEMIGQDPARISLAGVKLFDQDENVELLESQKIRDVIEAYARFFQRRSVTVPENLSAQLLEPGLIKEVIEEKL